ncbi:hypothetical protein CMI42_02135 [Candidatus Pacearchaeota archaeon]|nr:hypothetical protein [Candidatus Pacearchaeota archaeon]
MHFSEGLGGFTEGFNKSSDQKLLQQIKCKMQKFTRGVTNKVRNTLNIFGENIQINSQNPSINNYK